MLKGFEYTQEYFNRCLMQDKPFEVVASKEWSDDPWYKDQNNRKFIKNSGFRAINNGEAKGTIIGANLCTFNPLQGTEYMPNLKDKILFIEDDEESKPQHFDRDLQSLIHQPGFDGIRGIVIGRFQNASNISYELLTKIIKTKKELEHIPVVYGLDFGHTSPYLTFPIGGTISIYTKGKDIKIQMIKH
jgi:muramoyltetrapeptide carboxypeptidase LdcA involved in peptidoglycan recycling